jgi:hypothetical protein
MGIQYEGSLTTIFKKKFKCPSFLYLWVFPYVYTVWRKDDNVRFRAFS